MFLEVGLICVQHTIEPREQLLRAVIGMEDNWDTVGGSYSTNVVSCSDSAGNGSLLLVILDTLRNAQFCSLSAHDKINAPCPRNRQHLPEKLEG